MMINIRLFHDAMKKYKILEISHRKELIIMKENKINTLTIQTAFLT
jgi:hypothetical protein